MDICSSLVNHPRTTDIFLPPRRNGAAENMNLGFYVAPLREKTFLDWLDGFGKSSGAERVEDFFSRDPTAARHCHAILHVIHRFH